MGRQIKEATEIKGDLRVELPGESEGAKCDAGAAYRQARAHVLEASMRGLVRLRIAV